VTAFALEIWGIRNIADGVVTTGARRIANRLKISKVDVDFYAKIDAAAFDGVTKLCATIERVLGNVRSNDDLAASANQFIDPQILEVTAIGKIDESLIIGGGSRTR